MSPAGRGDRGSGRRRCVVAVLAVAAARLAAGPGVPAASQVPQVRIPDARYAGLQWTFARVRYTAWTRGLAAYSREWWGGEPWQVDWNAAEDNLSRRLRSVTAIQVNDPVVVSIENEDLWLYPWLYAVEPGNLRFTDSEIPILREFLLRGGTLTFDDFHGPIEWSNVEREMKRVFPGRPIVDLPPDHPIFSCFYRLDAYPQVPGLGSFLNGRTWEKGGYVARLRAIQDDRGRAMVLINWNTDMGDGWEWSNAEEYPAYLKHTAEAYRMMINEIIYALTH